MGDHNGAAPATNVTTGQHNTRQCQEGNGKITKMYHTLYHCKIIYYIILMLNYES